MTTQLTTGQLVTTTWLNEVERRKPTYAEVLASQTTASDTYVDLATVGPSVTVVTGASALVIIGAYIDNNTDQMGGVMGYAISGATTRAAADGPTNFSVTASGASKGGDGCREHLATGLTPGSNTFTIKYRRAFGGTARFSNRSITIIPQD